MRSARTLQPQSLDVDDDGFVSVDEFRRFCALRMKSGTTKADVLSAFNSLASEKLPEAKLKEFVGHTPLQVIAGILLGVANTFIMYYCVL